MTAVVKITGDKIVEKLLRNLNTTKERKMVMSVIAEQMRAMQYTHFEKEQDEAGQAWQPLSPGRIKQRSKRVEGAINRRVGKELRMSGIKVNRGARRSAVKHLTAMADMPILRDTGRLVNSLTSKSSEQNAVVGTNVIYSRVHQYGYPQKNIPKRQYLYLTLPERQELVKIIDWELVYKKLQKS